MISVVSKALQASLQAAAAGRSDAPPSIAVMGAARLSEAPEGVVLSLWRTTANTENRQQPGFGRDVDGRLPRPDLVVDLHYLAFASAADADREQAWLGWLLEAFAGVHVLRLDVQPVISLVPEALALADDLDLRRTLGVKAPIVTVVARAVPLDTTAPAGPAPPVLPRKAP